MRAVVSLAIASLALVATGTACSRAQGPGARSAAANLDCHEEHVRVLSRGGLPMDARIVVMMKPSSNDSSFYETFVGPRARSATSSLLRREGIEATPGDAKLEDTLTADVKRRTKSMPVEIVKVRFEELVVSTKSSSTP